MTERISEYRLVHDTNIDVFQEDVNDAICDGFQPVNRHGYKIVSNRGHNEYSLEMVKILTVRDYEAMVSDVQADTDDSPTAEHLFQRVYGRDGETQEQASDRLARLLRSATRPQYEEAHEVTTAHFDESEFQL
jgi:hypothetical protein